MGEKWASGRKYRDMAEQLEWGKAKEKPRPKVIRIG
jgi:hypothetical protein